MTAALLDQIIALGTYWHNLRHRDMNGRELLT